MEPAQQYSAFLPQVMEIQKNLLALADRPADLVRYLPSELRQITGARCAILVGCPDGMASGRHILGISQDPGSQPVDETQVKPLIDLLCYQDKPALWRPDDGSAAAPILRSLGFGFSHGIPLVSREVRVGGLFLLGLDTERDFTSIRETLRQLVSIVALALHNAFLFEGQEKLIAERTRQLEESNAALRKSQEKLRAFFEADLFGSHTGTIHGSILEANDEFLRTVGYTRQDLEAGKVRWTDLTPPEYLHLDEEHIGEAQARGWCRPFEKEYTRKDGSRVWVLVGFILVGEKREDSVVFTLDISGHKKETERLETILNNIPIMIDYFDASGKLEWGNRCWEQTLGWTLEEARAHGGTLSDHYPDPEYRKEILDWIHLADGKWRDCTTRTRDGRMLETTWANIRLSDGSNIGIGRDVSERKQAEDALRESQETLRAFFNSNLFGTTTGDIYGNIFDANDEYLRLVGYSRQDLEAGRLRWDELTPPEYMPLDEKAIAEAREHGACTPFEKQYIRRDGSRVWVLVGFILFGENREKSASFALNISGRKQETERLQAILDNIPVMIDHFNSAGKFTWANQYWEKTLGWPLGEALERGSILEEIYPDPSLRRSVVEHIQHTRGVWKDSQIRARDGRILDTAWAEVRLSDGSIYGIGQDVTERKRAEDELRESEKRYRLISEHSADVIWTLDLATWRFTYVSPSVFRLRGYTPEEVMAQPVSAVMSPDSYRYVVENMPPRLAAFAAGDESKRSMTTIIQQPRRDGSLVTTEVATTLVTNEEGQVVELLGVSRDISERLSLEADRRVLEERFRRLAENAQDIIYRYRVFPDAGFEYISPAITAILGYTPEEMYASPEMGTQLIFPEDQQQLEDLIDQGANRPVALRWKRKDGKLIWIEMRFTVIMDEVGRRVAFEGIARDVTERVQRQRELEAMVTLSAALRTAPDQASLVATILGQVYRMLEADGCALSLKEPNSKFAKTVLANGRIAHITGVRIPADKGVSGYAMQTGQLYLTQNFASDPHAYMPEMLGELQSVACAPLISQGVTIGVLMIARMTEIDSHEARMLTAIADIAANALQRTSLYESATRHARQMAAVSEIGRALSETLDLSNIFRLLDRYLHELLPDISRVSVSFYNAARQQFTCVFTSVDGKAIDCSQLAPTPLAPPGLGTQSQVIYTRKTLIVNNLSARQKTGALGRPPAADKGEESHAGLYAPMLTHKAIIGVIHVQSMTPNRFTEEDAELLATVANTAAVAIENTRLLADLQRSNQDLVRAYDTTLAGWSRALDLRDKETEGHTQRVADWAVKLAIRLGIGGEALVNVQRGALLHDIGKMGVPDEILRKPGKFTPEEWKIMQQHARYAYDLLRPIEYLRGVLDIPYCHHEKWDGSGYPRGLFGVQIPLAARVFAVIDVWDALCNERPYRPAWSPQDALEYIRLQSGKHFDPDVVEAFLKMVGA